MLRTLLVDNYDSYTYNLYQILAQVNGNVPIVIYNDEFDGDWEVAKKHLKGQFDNIVISPGPGHPSRANDFGLCADIIRDTELNVPIFGVCIGHQGISGRT